MLPSLFGRTATDEYTEQAVSSLEGGERTSPLRITVNVDDRFCIDDDRFCIDGDDDDDESEDSDSDSDNDNDSDRGRRHITTSQDMWHPPELPSLLSSEHIPIPPANYICPLTLQLMEDPVQDSCGHIFERRAILELLDRSSGSNSDSGNISSNSHSRAAVCPISRKPLMPLSCSGAPVEHNNNNNNNNNNTDDSSFCYDLVLNRNEGLQNRIQEWKLQYPLYQGVDASYAERQREKMLSHNTINITNTSNNSIHYASIDCPYGDDEAIDGGSSHAIGSVSSNHQHHRLSRFELLFLPQEREVRKILKERSREEQQRLNRSRWRLVASIVLTILFLVGVLYTVIQRGRVE
jgi:hypothetical protein